MESDCLVATQAIRSKVAMSFFCRRVVEDCRKFFTESQTLSSFHIKRSANMAAMS